ncbi:MAG: HAMP domain-containing sensor histidine kinase [Nocardioidaceae bacterium]
MTGRGRPRSGFGLRLLGAQALVLLAGAATTWVVASLVGPGIFRDHLDRAGVVANSTDVSHVEKAFAAAMLISISIALVTATAAALTVTWYFSRRIQSSVGQVAEAAAQVADGHFATRVRDPGLGREFRILATTSNAMADRLRATDTTRRRMLADLAHEMRTPLATIDAHLEAIEDGVRSADEDTLEVIRLSTHRLRRLAEDVSSVSTAEEGGIAISRRPVVASDLARAAAEATVDRFAAADVVMETDLCTGVRVLGDPDRLGQVLGNLLDNALRHTSPGGTVRLTCRSAGEWVELVVADTGSGIAAAHLGQVFDRFYRADTARDRGRGGSGIGLSIAKALVEAHDGTITASSAGEGQGATFTVRLPAARP